MQTVIYWQLPNFPVSFMAPLENLNSQQSSTQLKSTSITENTCVGVQGSENCVQDILSSSVVF